VEEKEKDGEEKEGEERRKEEKEKEVEEKNQSIHPSIYPSVIML